MGNDYFSAGISSMDAAKAATEMNTLSNMAYHMSANDMLRSKLSDRAEMARVLGSPEGQQSMGGIFGSNAPLMRAIMMNPEIATAMHNYLPSYQNVGDTLYKTDKFGGMPMIMGGSYNIKPDDERRVMGLWHPALAASEGMDRLIGTKSYMGDSADSALIKNAKAVFGEDAWNNTNDSGRLGMIKSVMEQQKFSVSVPQDRTPVILARIENQAEREANNNFRVQASKDALGTPKYYNDKGEEVSHSNWMAQKENWKNSRKNQLYKLNKMELPSDSPSTPSKSTYSAYE